jgi:asparagine synthase (glutamine-hydrolysing)
VRLTGNFGSEVLRSMSTFKPLGLHAELIDPAWSDALESALRRVAKRNVHPVTHAAFEEIPWHLSGSLQAARSQLTVRTPFLDNDIVALAYQAPAGLRQSPQSSLHLVRDHAPDLARVATDRGIAWAMPVWRSAPLRLFCAVTFKLDYWHKEGLPEWLPHTGPLFDGLDALGLLGLHKYLPYRLWFRRELASYVADVVHDVRARRMPFWNHRFLDTVVQDHVRGRANRLRELGAILTLEAVDRMLISAKLPTDTATVLV